MHNWPHSPRHFLDGAGAYIVTAATYRKAAIFRGRNHLDQLLAEFQSLATKYEIGVQAWAMFPNHYHFVAMLSDPKSLRRFIQHFHSTSARGINHCDNSPGRKGWFQYWETHLTYERSYFARLRYVHENAVRHGVVRVASQYPWCSAGWFERKAEPAFRKSVSSFSCDKLDIPDTFEVAIEDF